MTNIFFRFWKNISVLVLTIVFLFCYANLPDTIAYQHTEDGKAIKFIDKQSFFYATAALLFIFNLLFAFLSSQLTKLDYKSIFKNSAWAQNEISLRKLIKGWCDAFVAIINTYLVFVLLGLNKINANDNQRLDLNYNWIIMVGAVLVIILIFSLPFRLLFGSPKTNDN